MHVHSDSAILLTASESPESESFSQDSDPLLSAFESDGDFAASAIQFLGHFPAPGRIPPPVTTEDDAQDSEVINEYAAMLREPGSTNTESGHCKCSIILSLYVDDTLQILLFHVL
jgi:hypothetical protein